MTCDPGDDAEPLIYLGAQQQVRIIVPSAHAIY